MANERDVKRHIEYKLETVKRRFTEGGIAEFFDELTGKPFCKCGHTEQMHNGGVCCDCDCNAYEAER